MVSFLSFFQFKKKSKRAGASSPTSPSTSAPSTTAQPSSTSAAAQSDTRPGLATPGRFASLRHKSGSTKRYDPSSRRASSEISRKRSQVKAASTKTESSTTVLPKLDLNFDLGSTGDRGNDNLGLHGVGEKAVLTSAEREVLDKLSLGTDNVRRAWEAFGRALRYSDLNVVGLMLPHRLETDPTTQLYLLALYALTVKPDLLPSFPTISAQFAQPTCDASNVWHERLLAITKDVERSADLAEVLKYVLRRLHPVPPEPLIDIGLYTKFVRQEHASSYPLDAYGTLLVPRLKAGVPAFLDEIFEVWSAIATHADHNTMAAGRMAYLLGWWTWGLGGGQIGDWNSLYKDWQAAGKRMEHMLYAWIRYQSTRIQIPTRLLEIVDNYPFGESSASSEHLPLPPPSSFPRQTLHVTLSSTASTSSLFETPEDILSTTFRSKAAKDTSLPLWTSLRSDDERNFSEVLADSSLDFLRKAARASAQTPPPSPNSSVQKTPANVDAGPLYRPFSTVSAGRTSPRVRSFSQDAINSSDVGSSPPQPEVKKQTSLSVLPKSHTGGSVWDDFQKSGFDDSPQTFGELGLALTTKPTAAPISGSGSDVRLSDAHQRPVAKKRTTFLNTKSGPSAEYAIVSEDVIEIDDIFMSFVEDAQLDPPSVSTWPPFVLARLASPLTSPDSSKERSIEWLLITVVHRPVPVPDPETSEPEPHARPTSPSSSKAGTSRGFREMASSFKRSSSFQSSMGLRRSFFGASGFSLSKQAGSDELGPLPESDGAKSHQLRAPPSAASLTPTEYTVGEMGEVVKIPTAAEKAEREKALSAPPKDTDEITVKGQSASAGPSGTLASEWKYIGEGAEHIVFAYGGGQSCHTGKVIRLSKSKLSIVSSSPSRVKDAQTEWRTSLLPKLIPANLLLQSSDVDLDEAWLREVLAGADHDRPEKRKEGLPLAERVKRGVRGLLMENVMIDEQGDGKTTLAVEIKPKWGFLPSPERIQPSEAAAIKSTNCRFCMHQPLQDSAPTQAKYCPLDLFSGDEARMTRALEGLWGMWAETEGKRNNWRIFVAGKRISPEEIDRIPVLNGEGDVASTIVPLVLSALRLSKALDHLKSLQATLDPTDISDLASRFTSAYPNATLFDPALVDAPSASELQDFVDVYLSEPEGGKAEEAWTLRQRMVAYSLSAIFKDCSIFVKLTFARSGPTDTEGERWEPVKDSGKVKLVDLDLKPIQNLDRWYKRDEEIWRHWLETHPSTDQGEVGSEAKEDPPSDGGKDEARLDVPLRYTKVSGLTMSEGGEDGASTRALFVLTPDRTRENTPLPTPALTVIDNFSVRDTLAISDEPATSDRGSVQGVLPAEHEERGDGEESRSRLDSLASTSSGPAERKQRSLAPSPSPSIGKRELQDSQVHEEDVPDKVPVFGGEDQIVIGASDGEASAEPTTPEAQTQEMAESLVNPQDETPAIEATDDEDQEPSTAHTEKPDPSEPSPATETAQHVPAKYPSTPIEEIPAETSLSMQGDGEAFFTPAETPMTDLAQPQMLVSEPVPAPAPGPEPTADDHVVDASPEVEGPSAPVTIEDVTSAETPAVHAVPVVPAAAEAHSETVPSALVAGATSLEGATTASPAGTPKLTIIPIEDATPNHDTARDLAQSDSRSVPVHHHDNKVDSPAAQTTPMGKTDDPFVVQSAQPEASEESLLNASDQLVEEKRLPEASGQPTISTEPHVAPSLDEGHSDDIAPSPPESAETPVEVSGTATTSAGEGTSPTPTDTATEAVPQAQHDSIDDTLAAPAARPQDAANPTAVSEADGSTGEGPEVHADPVVVADEDHAEIKAVGSSAPVIQAGSREEQGPLSVSEGPSLIDKRSAQQPTDEAEPEAASDGDKRSIEGAATPATAVEAEEQKTGDSTIDFAAAGAHTIELGRPIDIASTSSTPSPSDDIEPSQAETEPSTLSDHSPVDPHPEEVQDDAHSVDIDESKQDEGTEVESESEPHEHEHELTTIDEEGESSVPTSSDMTRQSTDISEAALGSGSEMGEQWVEDVGHPEDDTVSDETPKAAEHPALYEELFGGGHKESETSQADHAEDGEAAVSPLRDTSGRTDTEAPAGQSEAQLEPAASLSDRPSTADDLAASPLSSELPAGGQTRSEIGADSPGPDPVAVHEDTEEPTPTTQAKSAEADAEAESSTEAASEALTLTPAADEDHRSHIGGRDDEVVDESPDLVKETYSTRETEDLAAGSVGDNEPQHDESEQQVETGIAIIPSTATTHLEGDEQPTQPTVLSRPIEPHTTEEK